MNAPRTAFLGWPGWRVLGEAYLLGAAQTLWFLLVYGGCDRLTALRSERVRVHLDFETSLPFVPAWILVYLSIHLLFFPGPFVLWDGRGNEIMSSGSGASRAAGSHAGVKASTPVRHRVRESREPIDGTSRIRNGRGWITRIVAKSAVGRKTIAVAVSARPVDAGGAFGNMRVGAPFCFF